ncbi:MAG TPA: transketolase [Planctomycetota bacterium]|nr:transketolase [Planctomycetota bacterium]
MTAAPVLPGTPIPPLPDFAALAAIAHELRVDVLTMLNKSGSGHPGGSLGMADVFTTLWFGGWLNTDPAHPDWPDRDRFVLSNGHICPILYAILARKGYFPREDLATLRKLGSHLQGHPDFHFTKGVDACTGSLGNGLSVALGIALGARKQGKAFRVYAGSSDGESQEGQVWEMATAAAHHKVDNLTVLVDWNGIQIDGYNRDVMDVRDLRAKYEAFGWHAQTVDGQDMRAVDGALRVARTVTGQPQVILCRTVLGWPVSFMLNKPHWHGVAPDDSQLAQALAELGAR